MFYFCTFIAFTSFLLSHSIAFTRGVCAFSGRYIAIGSVKLFVLDKFNLQRMLVNVSRMDVQIYVTYFNHQTAKSGLLVKVVIIGSVVPQML